MSHSILGIYRQRDDGAFEFVAALNKEEFAHSAIVTLTTAIMENNNRIAAYHIQEFSEPDMPSVLEVPEKDSL